MVNVTKESLAQWIAELESQPHLSLREERYLAVMKFAQTAEAQNTHLELALRKSEVVSEKLRLKAEDVENENFRLNRESQNLSNQLGACDRERRDFRAKLVELEKKEI